MNKLITTLILTGLLFACKPKSEDIKPIEETACRKLTYTCINTKNNKTLVRDTYVYDKTDKLIEIQGLASTYKYEYDAKDNVVKVTRYSKNQGSETKSSVTESTFNEANQITRQVTSVITETGAFKKQTEYLYEYHANGKMKKWTWYDLTMVFEKPIVVAEYDESGNEVLTHFYDGIYKKFEYNAANSVVKETYYDAANNPISESRYEYNSQNKYIKVSDYYNGVLSSYATYEYNSKGQQISIAIYKADGALISKTTTEYTGENYKISNYDPQNKLTGYSTIEMQNGLRMKESSYHDNKLVSYTIYAYDSHKNKIKQEEFNDALETPLRQEWTYQCD